MGKRLFLFLAVVLVGLGAYAQQPDSLALATADSAAVVDSIVMPDLTLVEHALGVTSPFTSVGSKPVVNDIQQLAPAKSNATIFALLIILLVVITYVKAAFNKDLEDTLQSFINRNMAQQVFRTQFDELTVSSLLLHANFVIVLSLFVRFVLVRYFHVSALESFSSILFFIFLFTFFYGAKIITLKVIGNIFEVSDVCDEYIFNFTTACKTLGLTLIPALFVFYAAPEKFFNFIFIFSLIIIAAFVLMFVYRGLSTAYKLLYRSVYHFFIYVCVVEVSPIFLLFKLLTKTVV